MLRGTDLRLDDVDRQVLLLAADQSRDPIPAARGALVGIRALYPSRSTIPTARAR